VVPTRRIGSESLPSHAKHANYLNSIIAHTEAAALGADDALLLGVEGNLAEASSANLFLVNGARILTPDLKTGILPGCTRAFVLELCVANGLSADEARLDPNVLDDVEEVFLTNSVAGIVPVRAVDHRGYAAPGPVTLMLMDLYRRGVEAELGPDF
jgi:branched-subunit amino acid aminotransferase/4-amino-4-deoxychorismate lyase